MSAPGPPSVLWKLAEPSVPHGCALLAPAASGRFNYEGELAVVIGRGGARTSGAEALSHAAGCACMNDGSVRDVQKHSVWAGKTFARSGGIGPWLATADEVGGPRASRS